MKHRNVLAAAATAALCSAAVLTAAPPASANGGHDDDGYDGDGYDVVIPLSERASKQLRDGNNRIAATGKADAWSRDGQVVLSFPVAGGDHRRTGDRATRLKGGVAYTGAGPTITWDRLKVKDNGVISAKLRDGSRAAILRVAGDRSHHRGGGHGGYRLVLTRVGAASLNNAAQGAPFSAGDVFAGGNDCR